MAILKKKLTAYDIFITGLAIGALTSYTLIIKLLKRDDFRHAFFTTWTGFFGQSLCFILFLSKSVSKPTLTNPK